MEDNQNRDNMLLYCLNNGIVNISEPLKWKNLLTHHQSFEIKFIIFENEPLSRNEITIFSCMPFRFLPEKKIVEHKISLKYNKTTQSQKQRIAVVFPFHR